MEYIEMLRTYVLIGGGLFAAWLSINQFGLHKRHRCERCGHTFQAAKTKGKIKCTHCEEAYILHRTKGLIK